MEFMLCCAILDKEYGRVLVFWGSRSQARSTFILCWPAVSAVVVRLSPGSPSFADLVFVGVYLEFMLLVNLVCISDRCGKTSICQVFAALANQKLYSVNCHLHMETSDFLGGLRPVRQKPKDKVCPIASDDVYIHLKDAVSSVP